MAKLRNMKKLMSDRGMTERIERAKETSKEVSWEHWYDDMPTSQEMVGFLTMLKQYMPMAKFYPAEFDRTNHVKPDNTYEQHYLITEFSVYMDNYPFDLGRVGFRDYSVDGNSEPSYGVYSRKIENTKYASNRDQYFMMMSTDMKKGVKNASKYVVPYTHKELAQAFYDRVHNHVEQVYSDKQAKMQNVASEITRNTKGILAELLHLKSLGVQFKTEAFIKASEMVEEAVLEQQEEEKRNVTGVFVRFRTVGDEMYVDVLEAEDIRKNYKLKGSSQTTTYLMSDLPGDIAGSISVLNILEDGQYVARVGQKVDDTTFWIERG